MLTHDPFAPDVETFGRTLDPSPSSVLPPSTPDVVEENYRRLLETTDRAHHAARARRRASLARDAAHAFGEYARGLRRVAATKGSEIDHLVALDLAEYCETQAVAYVRLQAEAMTVADRAGSV